jgi:uncharacterized membrane protein
MNEQGKGKSTRWRLCWCKVAKELCIIVIIIVVVIVVVIVIVVVVVVVVIIIIIIIIIIIGTESGSFLRYYTFSGTIPSYMYVF